MTYAEHLGFVSAPPEDWPKSGPQSRAEMHQKRTGRPVPMPPVPVGGYLVRAFRELGAFEPTSDGGMLPLSFAEISAGFPWVDERERLLLKNMSRAFIRGWKIGRDVLGIPPWRQESD